MPETTRSYIAIDLKSFYASVECVDRGLDPLDTNLVVADASRTEKTICLAVSPSLKAYGVGGRARLFEVVQKVREINRDRERRSPVGVLMESSYSDAGLKKNPCAAVDYIAAPPRMARYMEVSTQIYNIYLRYIAPEDIHVYSIDEVFIDASNYLKTYKMTARELTVKILRDVLADTGITATAGIGTNMYLCKIAMDIVAKKIPADENGVRIAELDEMSYRRKLWNHRPLTDFWRIGKGYERRLESLGLYTMGDVARCSIGDKYDYCNEELLYKTFGVNAELLIDHAWGYESCTIADIKSYRPENCSISSGQVLHCPYDFESCRLILREMTDLMALDLVDKGLVTNHIVLTVGYDTENISNIPRMERYGGEVACDHYGRLVPKSAHGSVNTGQYTSSARLITEKTLELFDRIADRNLTVRRVNIAAEHIIPENCIPEKEQQLDLFTDYEELAKENARKSFAMAKENKIQKTVLELKKRFGKNSVLRGMNLEEGATAVMRNGQVGGHRA